VITYGQTLADSTLTGGSASVPGSFAFSTPRAAPHAGTAPQYVTFSAKDSSNYSQVPGTVTTATLNLNKGLPLPVGSYQLLVCGTTSIHNGTGVKLNSGLSDSRFTFEIIADPPEYDEEIVSQNVRK
jgi:hypothetical protein